MNCLVDGIDPSIPLEVEVQPETCGSFSVRFIALLKVISAITNV